MGKRGQPVKFSEILNSLFILVIFKLIGDLQFSNSLFICKKSTYSEYGQLGFLTSDQYEWIMMVINIYLGEIIQQSSKIKKEKLALNCLFLKLKIL